MACCNNREDLALDQLGSVVEAEWATVLYIPEVVKEVLPQIEATTNPF
jgi:hypothetical protein